MRLAQTGSIMEIASVPDAIAWQARHMEEAGSPNGARLLRGLAALLNGETATGRRIRDWPGLSLEAAMPLRIAGGLHHLFLSGAEPVLGAIFAGRITDQSEIDQLVREIVARHDGALLPWLDGPPQTNEAGRSASVMAGLLWLSARLGPAFELIEIGASAGVNTMIDRYGYDLGGTRAGPPDSPMQIVPEWRGPPPPQAPVEIVGVKGCDLAPLDLTDPAQALRLKSYVWPEAKERIARMDAAIALATKRPPDLVQMDAGQFVAQQLSLPQADGVTRVLFHSIVWQYLPEETRSAITSAMQEAGAAATVDRPLAWIALETNRKTFRHELTVRYWPGGEKCGGEPVLLAEAHPHGAWVEWRGSAG